MNSGKTAGTFVSAVFMLWCLPHDIFYNHAVVNMDFCFFKMPKGVIWLQTF